MTARTATDDVAALPGSAPPVAVYDLLLREPARAVLISVACGTRLEHARALAFTARVHDAAGGVLAPDQVGWAFSTALGAPFAYSPALPGPGTLQLPVLTAEVPFTSVHLEAVVWDRRRSPSVPVGQVLFAWETAGSEEQPAWTAVDVAQPQGRVRD